MEEATPRGEGLYGSHILDMMKIEYPFKEYLDEHPDLRTIVYAGKGGIGKSTASAATSLWLSREGKSCLCFSTDPQASLTDVFETDIFGKGIRKLRSNLYALEIDGDKRIANFQDEIRKKIRDRYKSDEIPKEIGEYISSASAEPAMYESATYDAMAELLVAGEHDIYIFDMPPFGHGVRMVSMSKVLDAWVDKMEEARREVAKLKKAEEVIKGVEATAGDEVMDELKNVRDKMDLFRGTLTDPKATAFTMVLSPEKMAILDTRRALKMFEKFGITLGGIVVNQVYPQELINKGVSDLLRGKIEGQRKYLDEIVNEFGEYVRAIVPMFDREPKGFDMLEKFAHHLFEELGM